MLEPLAGAFPSRSDDGANPQIDLVLWLLKVPESSFPEIFAVNSHGRPRKDSDQAIRELKMRTVCRLWLVH